VHPKPEKKIQNPRKAWKGPEKNLKHKKPQKEPEQNLKTRNPRKNPMETRKKQKETNL
jgi:hypothetical protein